MGMEFLQPQPTVEGTVETTGPALRFEDIEKQLKELRKREELLIVSGKYDKAEEVRRAIEKLKGAREALFAADAEAPPDVRNLIEQRRTLLERLSATKLSENDVLMTTLPTDEQLKLSNQIQELEAHILKARESAGPSKR